MLPFSTESRPARILLVEDDEGVRGVMRRALAGAGLDVVEAVSGTAAAALIERDAAFDMLVTDVRMPGAWDGVALASDWRQKVPGRPVLFVSGYSDGRLGPHEAVLNKPFRRICLMDAIQRLLDRHVGQPDRKA